jgi:hypothetical protein
MSNHLQNSFRYPLANGGSARAWGARSAALQWSDLLARVLHRTRVGNLDTGVSWMAEASRLAAVRQSTSYWRRSQLFVGQRQAHLPIDAAFFNGTSPWILETAKQPWVAIRRRPACWLLSTSGPDQMWNLRSRAYGNPKSVQYFPTRHMATTCPLRSINLSLKEI